MNLFSLQYKIIALVIFQKYLNLKTTNFNNKSLINKVIKIYLLTIYQTLYEENIDIKYNKIIKNTINTVYSNFLTIKIYSKNFRKIILNTEIFEIIFYNYSNDNISITIIDNKKNIIIKNNAIDYKDNIKTIKQLIQNYKNCNKKVNL